MPERRGPAPPPKPVTERILSSLPGPRLLWLFLWALLPWLVDALIVALDVDGRLPGPENAAVEVFNRAALSLAIVLSVWGTGAMVRGVSAIRSALAAQLGEHGDPYRPFRGMESTAGPLLLALSSAVIFAVQSLVEHDTPLRAVLAFVSWLLIGIAPWTLAWVYLALQLGLHRLGRRAAPLEVSLIDRSLGLRPLGTLAFTGFWTFVLALLPVFLATARNRLGLAIAVLILSLGLILFFLSLRRLNRHMVAVKRRELEWSRRLYEQAFEPVRTEGTLEALERQSSLLGAAEALEKRAERIQEWPFDEGTFARVVAISSTVVAAIVARVLLAPFGG